MNELPPNWLHQTLESTKAMNAQDQIKERAKDAMKALFFIPWNKDRIEAEFVKQLTAQQTADATAHREEVERLRKELAEPLEFKILSEGEILKEGDEIYDGDLTTWRKADFGIGWKVSKSVVGQYRRKARAESAKLREVLGKVVVQLGITRDTRVTEEAHYKARAELEDALALAATVLKEGKV